MNNRTLFIILLALIGLFVLSKVFKGDKSRSFDPLIVEVDTSTVSRIEITRKAEPGKTVTLTKGPEGWNVSDGDVSAYAPAANVAPTLAALSRIEAERIVARSRDKWAQYEVGEEASRIAVFSNGEKSAELVIGGFKFDQARRSASTYVRKGGQDEVYLVEGFLAMQLTQGMESYRDNTILKLDPRNVTRIELNSGDDVGIFTRDVDGTWYFAGMEAVDSTSMADYLNGLSNLVSRDFTTITPDEQSILASIRFSGNNMTPAEIAIYEGTSVESETPYVIRSSLNEDALFASDSSGVYKKVFGSLEQLMLEM